MIPNFVDRVVEHPGRRRLTPVDGQPDVYDVTREEGLVSEAGSEINAENLNKLIPTAELVENKPVARDAEGKSHFAGVLLSDGAGGFVELRIEGGKLGIEVVTE